MDTAVVVIIECVPLAGGVDWFGGVFGNPLATFHLATKWAFLRWDFIETMIWHVACLL